MTRINLLRPDNRKWCPKCKSLLHRADFATDRTRKDRLDAWCRACRSQAHKRARDTYPWEKARKHAPSTLKRTAKKRGRPPFPSFPGIERPPKGFGSRRAVQRTDLEHLILTLLIQTSAPMKDIANYLRVHRHTVAAISRKHFNGRRRYCHRSTCDDRWPYQEEHTS